MIHKGFGGKSGMIHKALGELLALGFCSKHILLFLQRWRSEFSMSIWIPHRHG